MNVFRRTPHQEADPRLQALIDALGTPRIADGPLPGEQHALAAFQRREDLIGTPRILARRRTPVRALAASAIVGGLSLSTGVGAAMAGVLPGAAQDTAREWLAKVGVEVPGADERAGDNPDRRGRSDDAKPTADPTEESGPVTETDSQGQGEEISDLARNTEAEGREKGAAVSEAASGGKSRAGDERPATTRRTTGKGTPPTDARPDRSTTPAAPRVEVPNRGGTGTATEHTDKAAGGVDHADDVSDGRSEAGSGNR